MDKDRRQASAIVYDLPEGVEVGIERRDNPAIDFDSGENLFGRPIYEIYPDWLDLTEEERAACRKLWRIFLPAAEGNDE